MRVEEMSRRLTIGCFLILILIPISFAKTERFCTEILGEQSLKTIDREWNATFGGVDWDFGRSMIETGEGGFALAGSTYSFGSGSSDMWLVNTDANGKAEWNQTFGGSNIENAYSIIQTVDGGFALAGNTLSYGAGNSDMWLVKTGTNGQAEWNQTFGGIDDDQASSILQTADGGYILAGKTGSISNSDILIVKTDINGTEEWNRSFGGDGIDYSNSIIQTVDGGFAIGGTSSTTIRDFWLIKINASGHMEWNQTYGGMMDEQAGAMIQTSDGGYALVGYTQSYSGSADFWLVKTDLSGQVEWNQTYEGTGVDFAYAVTQTSDGGYALAGNSESFGDKDIRLVKTDNNGQLEWNQIFGGTSGESASSVILTADGGYVLAGHTSSYGVGNADFWMIKFIPKGPIITVNNSTNNTFQMSGKMIDISVTNLYREVSHVWYIWNNNGTKFNLSDPYDLPLIGPETQHFITVYANDTLGFLSSLSLVFIIDDTPPTSVVTGIENQTSLNGLKIISIIPSDLNGIQEVKILLNDEIVITYFSGPYQFNWNTSDQVNGEYVLSILVIDLAGNTYRENYIIRVANTEETTRTVPLVGPERILLLLLGLIYISLRRKVIHITV